MGSVVPADRLFVLFAWRTVRRAVSSTGWLTAGLAVNAISVKLRIFFLYFVFSGNIIGDHALCRRFFAFVLQLSYVVRSADSVVFVNCVDRKQSDQNLDSERRCQVPKR